MKNMILVASLLVAQGSFAYNCDELDAQFIGYVRSVQKGANGTCEAKLSFPGATSSYNPNTLCPLDINEVVASTVTVACNTQVDDILAGYLIRTVGESKIRLSY
jgi:predicted small secreted protein